MSFSFYSALFLIFVSMSFACETRSVSPTSNPLTLRSTPAVSSSPELQEEKLAADFFVKDKSLSYEDFELVKLYKELKLENVPGLTEVSYAELQKNGKRQATFDDVYSGFGNGTEFGLFSLLGDETKQFIISQTIPRSGKHWIVSVSPEYHLLLDSREFNVGREDVFITDVDGDKVNEICLELTAFYGFENLAPSVTPLPRIIFKYDAQKKKYLPANQIFPAYSLKGIEEDIESLAKLQGETRFPRVLDITLRYIFAGKEREAWAFFDRECKMENANELKTKILSLLKNQPVYKFIHQ